MPAAKPKTDDTPVVLPDAIAWTATTLVRSGGFSTTPPPDWAVESVEQSYQATMANASAAAFTTTLADEKTAKAVLHQLRRAANAKSYGLSASIEGGKLTFQAKKKKQVAPKV